MGCSRDISMPASPDARRTRAALLAEVRREVDLMAALSLRGPVSLLRGRLVARGVGVTEATLRSGDCRALLERVWVRRTASRRRHGPTAGHDLRSHARLVDTVIDLLSSVARVRADLDGRVVDHGAARDRDPRSVAVCAHNAGRVAATAALIARVVADLGALGPSPDIRQVSEELARRGKPLSVRSIQRRDEYRRPIRSALSIHDPVRPFHPDRTALSRMCREELGAMVVRLQAGLAALNAEFEATLV